MALAIQTFLRSGKTLDDLRLPPYALVIQEGEDARVMFNYDQIDSDRTLVITQEARGLILERGTWDVVSLGFHRFFNFGEGPAAPVEFSKAYALEKVDGSYISYYYYAGQWRASTRGSIRASGQVGDFPFTFAELIARAQTPALVKGAGLSSEYTYIFELVSPYNKIVTPYEFVGLYLIGARHRSSGSELPYSALQDLAKGLGVRIPAYHSFADSEAILKYLQTQIGRASCRERV